MTRILPPLPGTCLDSTVGTEKDEIARKKRQDAAEALYKGKRPGTHVE